MKKLLNIFSFIFCAVILFSCEPSRAENGDFLFGVQNPGETGGGTGGGGNTGSTKRLKKQTVVDPQGLTSYFEYNYTGDKLTSVHGDDDGDISDYTLNYTNNILTQLIVKEDDGSDVSTTTLNLVYQNGKLISSAGNIVSQGTEINKNVTSYTYNTNGTLKKISTSIQSEAANPGTYVEMFSLISDFIFTGNNISTWKFTLTAAPMPPITIPPIIITANVSSYDTFKNPLATLPEAFTIAGAHFMTATNAAFGLSTNNYKTVNVEGESATYVYTYDADGYPTKATSENGTISYEYIP